MDRLQHYSLLCCSGLTPCTEYQFWVEEEAGAAVVWAGSTRTLVSLDIELGMGHTHCNISARYRSPHSLYHLEYLQYLNIYNIYNIYISTCPQVPPGPGGVGAGG